MNLITLHNAAFGYERNPIVSNVSLEIGEGEFIGLVGVNGAGKTTLMKGLLGLLKPLAGRVDVSPAARHHIGYVPQRGHLDPIYPLTVFDVVRMGLDRGKEGLDVRECLEKVRLAELADRPYTALSGGQQQRVLIARALAVAPRVLMLDEPTSGVDAVTEREIMEVLKDLNASERLAVLLVSHKIPELHRYASKVIFLRHDGIQQGTPQEVLPHEKWEQIMEDVL